MMFELSTPVLIDSETHGVVVGRGYDMTAEIPYFDVKIGRIIVYNVKPHRLTVAGPGRQDVIGRDVSHNPKRTPRRLPTPDDIVNENFTGGLSTKEYLRRLREGSL